VDEMNKRGISVLVILIAAVVLAAGCSAKAGNDQKNNVQNVSSSPTPGEVGKKENPSGKISSKDLERVNEEGAVAVSATYANPIGQGKKGNLTFIVFLNTHSVDLARYPLNQYAKLYDAKGNLLSSISEWEQVSGDGHHIVGNLHFKDTGFNLQNLDGIKLVIENYGGAAKRELVWEKKYLTP
jgi:hypothetical protein